MSGVRRGANAAFAASDAPDAAFAPSRAPASSGRRRRRRGGGGGEPTVVPPAEFRSYYSRPVLKAPVWEWKTPAYLFSGGLMAGVSVVAASADVTGRPVLRRNCRLGALGALLAGVYFLVTDLGRPLRFLHMLRVAKPTSPMSMGTWILTAYGPVAAVAAVAEVVPLIPGRWRWSRWLHTWPAGVLRVVARPTGLAAAAVAPAVASYTAALLAQTAAPGWHEVRRELPFVFTGSAAASGGGFGLLVAPVAENDAARVFAALGAAQELVASRVMVARMGLEREAYEQGAPARRGRAAEYLTAAGLAGTVLLAGRSRAGAAASGLALLAGSAFQRFRVFAAGVETTKDPRYVVVPQRERLAAAAHPATRP